MIGTTPGPYLAALLPILVACWGLSASTQLTVGMRACCLVLLLSFCFAVTSLEASHWQSKRALVERAVRLHPDRTEFRLLLAETYLEASTAVETEQEALTLLSSARSIFLQDMEQEGASIQSVSSLIVLDSLRGTDVREHYALLQRLTLMSSVNQRAQPSIRRLLQCIAKHICPAPDDGIVKLLSPALAVDDGSVSLYASVFSYCMVIKEYGCVREYAERALDTSVAFLPAYTALYQAALIQQDVTRAQQLALRMVANDVDRRWLSLVRDYAAGRP